MPRLRYSSEAVDNLAAIAAYITITTDSEKVARGLVEQLRARCRKIAALPGTLGRSRSDLRPDMRSVAYKNYVIFFRYLDDTLEVVAVLEGHRDIVTYFADDDI